MTFYFLLRNELIWNFPGKEQIRKAKQFTKQRI